jgi:hypothetical protein
MRGGLGRGTPAHRPDRPVDLPASRLAAYERAARGVRLEACPVSVSHCLRRALVPAAVSCPACSAAAAMAPSTVVVTGAREALAPERLVGDVVVIDAERIRASAGDSLEDLLRREAGLQLSRSGGPGPMPGCSSAVPARPHAGACRRRAHRAATAGLPELEGAEPGADRAHRGAARPRLQPLRRRRRGRRGADLHPARQPNAALSGWPPWAAWARARPRWPARGASGSSTSRPRSRPSATTGVSACARATLRQPQPRSRRLLAAQRAGAGRLLAGRRPAAGLQVLVALLNVAIRRQRIPAADLCAGQQRRLPQPHRAAVGVAAPRGALDRAWLVTLLALSGQRSDLTSGASVRPTASAPSVRDGTRS